MRKVRICFVAHNAHGAMVGDGRGRIGGAERLAALQTRWLAVQGYDTHMVTWDEGQPTDQQIDGVKVHTICRENAGVPGIRFFVPKWSSLVGTLRRIRPDVCCQNLGECVTGQVALWCRSQGRKFVYSVVSDPDCDPSLPEMRTRRERVLYRLGLRLADRITVQTKRQQQMLTRGFGVDSVVIPMPCAGPREGDFRLPDPPEPDTARVLWLGRVCDVKRPDVLLDVAEACPKMAFHLVGPYDDTPYARHVVDRAERMPNVVVHGRVPRETVVRFLRTSACMLSTSRIEGFPNTFLEAWSHGLPIVSTFDPDGLIR